MKLIEECYEFMLAYAAQGLPSDEGSRAGGQVREFLNRAAKALDGLAESFAASIEAGRPRARREIPRVPCGSGPRRSRLARRPGTGSRPTGHQFSTYRQPECLHSSARAAHGHVSGWRDHREATPGGETGRMKVADLPDTDWACRGLLPFLVMASGASVATTIKCKQFFRDFEQARQRFRTTSTLLKDFLLPAGIISDILS